MRPVIERRCRENLRTLEAGEVSPFGLDILTPREPVRATCAELP